MIENLELRFVFLNISAAIAIAISLAICTILIVYILKVTEDPFRKLKRNFLSSILNFPRNKKGL